jgi:hypothetical protein
MVQSVAVYKRYAIFVYSVEIIIPVVSGLHPCCECLKMYLLGNDALFQISTLYLLACKDHQVHLLLINI